MNKRGAVAFLGILAIVIASFAFAWMISSEEGILQFGPKSAKIPSTSVQMKSCGGIRFNPTKYYCADARKSILCHLGESLCGTKCYSSTKSKCASAEKSIVCSKNHVLCGNKCMDSCGKTVGSRGTVALGGSCRSDDDCGELDICVNRVCKEVGTVPDGGSCTVEEECEDFSCVRGKCSNGLLGAICECDIDGGDSCDLNYDIYCNKGSRICESWGGPGERCSACDEWTMACNNLSEFDCVRGKCSDGSTGMNCDVDYIPSCDNNNYCKNGICAPLIAQGSRCTSVGQCGNGNSCINGVCSPGVSGSPCDLDTNCDSNNYCSSRGICTLGAKLGEPCTMINNINSIPIESRIYCVGGLYCVNNICSSDSCYDSDGVNYNVKGTVFDNYGSYSDYCDWRTSYSLREFTCKVQEEYFGKNGRFGIDYNCTSGSCVDGACTGSSTPVTPVTPSSITSTCGDGVKNGNEVCDTKGNVGCGVGYYCAGCSQCSGSGQVSVSSTSPPAGTGFNAGGTAVLMWTATSTVTGESSTLKCNLIIDLPHPSLKQVISVSVQNKQPYSYSLSLSSLGLGVHYWDVTCFSGVNPTMSANSLQSTFKIDNCVDSDGGIVPTIAGTVTASWISAGGSKGSSGGMVTRKYIDWCNSLSGSPQAGEYYCENGVVRSTMINCANGCNDVGTACK